MIRNVIFDIGNVLTDFRWKGFLEDKGFDEEMVARIARASVLTPFWNEADRGYGKGRSGWFCGCGRDSHCCILSQKRSKSCTGASNGYAEGGKYIRSGYSWKF